MIADIQARLLAQTMGKFVTVGGAMDLAALGDQPPQTPSAYVYFKQDAAGENTRMMGVLQRVACDIGVMIITANVSDPRGEANAADLETSLKPAVFAALLGWQPPTADDVISYAYGKLIRTRDGVVWWEMTFDCAYYLESH